MNVDDVTLIKLLVRRDGLGPLSSRQPPHRAPGRCCPYYELYAERELVCPWCTAQDKRDV
jgi:hypothetical protein